MAKNNSPKKGINKELFKILAVSLIGIIILVVLLGSRNTAEAKAQITPEPTVEAVPVEQQTVSTPEPTLEPTPEPEPEYYSLSFIGDNTLWANANFVYSEYGLPKTVGDNYAYPYSQTASIFKEDEYTLANLECTLSDQSLTSAGETFSFKCPTSYVNILTEGNVDLVTMANNHTMDYYEAGRDDTVAALDSVGIKHVNEDEYLVTETPHGLKLGVYTGYNTYHPEEKVSSIENAIKDMKSQGADIIICMFHWGQELYYSPNDNQTSLAHKCIDFGADIVYGSHPHCLQPIEIYNGKLIMYSMGNWVFGGNTEPSDPDTAIVQAVIKKDTNGAISYDSYKIIPCAITSNIDGANAKANNTNYNDYAAYNNYCPTPYPEDNEGYGRVMAKLNGEFHPDKEGADYSNYYAAYG